jgi:pimeloyl-ACP methyl ester carboxylesterase
MDAIPRPAHFYTEPERMEVGGVEVAYRRQGEGEPVLYLHGAGFTRIWPPFHEHLSESVDLIAPEHPGYGETEMPDWLAGFDDLVIHYDEFAEKLGLEEFHLVGYSLGGWIAAEFAVFYPRRLKSLTLITPAGLRVPGHPVRDLVAMMPEELWDTIFNDKTQMERYLPAADDMDEVVHAFGEATTLARLAWNPQYDIKLEHRLERVKCPALVIKAEDDRLVPGEIGDRYAELLPDARVETVDGTGHALVLERPEECAGLIASFVSEASGAPLEARASAGEPA